MLNKAKLKGLFKGFIVGRESFEISHLQFADDIMFFAKPNSQNLVSLVRILKIFCLALGLKINLEKSVVLGISLREHKTQQLANIISCSVGNWSIK